MQQQQYQPEFQAGALQYVGVGPRFLAVLIDGIILGIVAALINAVFGSNQPVVSGSLTGVLGLAYYMIMEATQGATVGKMALGLRVVKEDGTAISWSESIIRNLLRIIDVLFLYLVGAIFIWTSPLKQRLGDRVAHTVVIKRR